MDRSQLLKVTKSAHHGFINYENQLTPSLRLFSTHSDIDIIEIDFIYYQGDFISSYDYEEENIRKGSPLSTWIEYIIYNDKILWIDIKDSFFATFSDNFSVFDINAFFSYLQKLEIQYHNLKNSILIGSKSKYLHNKLLEFNVGYEIVYDMPQSNILDEFIPSFIIKSKLLEYLSKLSELEIVCLDDSLFDDFNELTEFISIIPQKIIILYCYNILTTRILSNKHIIYQLNCYL